MGYRTYIGSMPKRDYNKIKSMTIIEVSEFYNVEIDNGYLNKSVYEYGKELYEFGKYTGFQPPPKSLRPFFKNKELMNRYSDYDFYIVTAEFLEYVITGYKEIVKQFYSKMIAPFYEVYAVKSEWLKSEKTNYLTGVNMSDDYTYDFSLITQAEQTAIHDILNHIKSYAVEWNKLTPFNLHDSRPSITESWKYEYAIFELVRIYKSFDWKRNVMIYYGY